MFNNKQLSLETFISKEVTIKGELITEGIVRIDGCLEGSIQADGLIIGRTGDIKGEINAREILVDGNIEGSINAQEILEIKPDGKVQGDILTSKLIIAEGAFFSGRSVMQRPPAASKEEATPAAPPADENKVKKLFKAISIF